MKRRHFAWARRISILYIIITAFWIVLSDRLLHQLAPDAARQVVFQTLKGLVFIVVTGGVMYVLLRRELKAQERVHTVLHNSEAQWRSLVENAPDMIATVNRQGEILFLNHVPPNLDARQAQRTSVFDYLPPEQHTTVRDAITSVFETGQPASCEIAIRDADGATIWYAAHIGPVKHNEHTHAAIMIARDVTARQQAEFELQRTLARVQSILQAAPVAIIHLDPDGVVHSWNPAAEQIFGWPADEAIGRVLPYVPPEKMDEFARLRARVMRGESFHGVEAQRRRKDGQEITIRISTAPMRDLKGNIIGIMAAVDDVTNRKRWERKLQESEEKYRQIVETAHEGIWVINADNETTFVNARMAEMLGYTVEEMLGQPVSAFLAADAGMQAALQAQIERRKQGERGQYELQFRRKDGTPLWTFISSNPLFDAEGRYRGSQAMLSDISALKAARDAEQEQRILAEALAQTAHALISTSDLDDVMHTILENIALVVPHDAANIMLLEGDQAPVKYWRGYSPEHIRLFTEFVPAVPETPNLRHMAETGESFLASYTEQYAGWVHVPLTEWVQSYVAVPIQSRREVIGFLNLDSGTPGHFTEEHAERLQIFADQASLAVEHAQLYEQIQRHAEQLEQRVIERTAELNHTKERVEAILNSSTDVIILCRVDGTIEQVNPAFEAVFHSELDEMFNWPLTTLVRAEARPRLERAFDVVTETHRAERLEIPIDFPQHAAFEADMVLSPIVDREHTLWGVVCSIRDISQRKQMEAQLRQMLEREMEFSELKSRYVSMAAHDLRNPLAVIQSAINIIENYRDRLSGEQLRAKFDTIETSIHTMVDMLDDILTLGRAESGRLTFDPAPLDLTAFCRQLAVEMQHNRPDATRIELSCSQTCATASLDAKLLRYILANLLSNALKYSPEDSPVILAVDCEPDQVTFRVRDQGVGIPEADQERLFEPFHRASNVGKVPGTGLGLAIVKQSVELHGGTIAWESEEGEGTTFTVMLPVVRLDEERGARAANR